MGYIVSPAIAAINAKTVSGATSETLPRIDNSKIAN